MSAPLAARPAIVKLESTLENGGMSACETATDVLGVGPVWNKNHRPRPPSAGAMMVGLVATATESFRSMYRLLFSFTATMARSETVLVLMAASESRAPASVLTDWQMRPSAKKDCLDMTGVSFLAASSMRHETQPTGDLRLFQKVVSLAP